MSKFWIIHIIVWILTVAFVTFIIRNESIKSELHREADKVLSQSKENLYYPSSSYDLEVLKDSIKIENKDYNVVFKDTTERRLQCLEKKGVYEAQRMVPDKNYYQGMHNLGEFCSRWGKDYEWKDSQWSLTEVMK